VRPGLAARIVAVALTLGAAEPAARGDVRRLALVDAGASLERAVRETLAPWGIAVLVIHPNEPGDSMPASAERARALAARHSVGAVAWISKSVSGYALWVYDGESGRVIARRLTSSPPFDEPVAAAVALSIKTLLRHSEVAPREERYAAGGNARARRRQVLLEAGGGAWVRDDASWTVEPRLGLALVWWPSPFRGRLAGTIGGHTGAGVTVDEPGFVGHYTETAVALGARVRFDLLPRLSLIPSVRGEVRFGSLDGVAVAEDEAVRARRANPSIATSLQLELRVAELRFGVRAGLSYLARRQRYLILGESIYELPSLGFDVAALVGVPIY